MALTCRGSTNAGWLFTQILPPWSYTNFRYQRGPSRPGAFRYGSDWSSSSCWRCQYSERPDCEPARLEAPISLVRDGHANRPPAPEYCVENVRTVRPPIAEGADDVVHLLEPLAK
jgi:hypothetical protein